MKETLTQHTPLTHTTTNTKLTKLTDNRSDNIKQSTDIRSDITIQEILHFSFADQQR